MVKAFFITIFFLFSQFKIAFTQIDLYVNDYTGLNKSFGISQEIRGDTLYIIPVSKKNGLDILDLQAALSRGHVVLKSSEGSIVFVLGLFTPPEKSGKLDIIAKQDVHFSMNNNAQYPLEINIIAGGSANIAGPGVHTNGKEFKCSAHNISVIQSGVNTGGADAEICALGNVIFSGEGIRTVGGFISIEGDSMKTEMDGIDAGFGTCSISMVHNTNISGRGIRCGNFVCSGSDFNLKGDGISSQKGTVNLFQTGNVSISGEGITSNGGSFSSTGNDLIVGGISGGSGIQTNGGEINIHHTGNLLVRARGIYAGSGSVFIVMNNNIDISLGGITTTNADIYLESKNGMIILDGMNLNTNIGEKSGDGVLDTSHISEGSLILYTEPVLGGGNITIKTHRPFNLESVSIRDKIQG